MKNWLMRKRVLVIAFAAMAATVALASGCLTYGATVIRVLTAGDMNYMDSTRLFFQEFEKQNPDIKIKIEEGGLDKFLVQLAAGMPYDVLRLYGNGPVQEYAAKGLIQDITERAKSSKRLNIDLFNSVILHDSLSWNDRIYAIPFGISVTALFYNRTLFDEMGVEYPDEIWSWEVQGLKEGKKFVLDRNGDKKIDRFFVWTGSYECFPFLYSAGSGPLFSHDWTQFLGNSKAVRVALQFLQELIHVHSIATTSGDLRNESVASYMQGSWYATALMRAQVPFSWDVALIPSFRGGRGTNVWSETPWAIPAGVKHPELSWRVLEFIGSAEGQALACKLGLGLPPVRLDVARTTFVEEYRRINAKAIMQMAAMPLTQALPTAPPTAQSPFYGVIDDVLGGRKSPDQALTEATPVIEAALEKARRELMKDSHQEK